MPIVVVVLVIVIFLLVTFAKANEGLDKYEQDELKTGEQQYLSKGKLNMNIYNKVTLSVILVITIVISFLFYFITTEKKVDKDTLYENKIANHKQSGNQKNGVASNNAIATKVGNKIIEDGGNAIDAAEGVAYALAVTEPHSSGLGGGVRRYHITVKMVKCLNYMNTKQCLHIISSKVTKLVRQDL